MTKILISEEAFKLYARRGYEATSMRQIADAVGIEKSSLYGHYTSKSEIFKEVLLKEFDSIEMHLLDGVIEDDSLMVIVNKVFRNTIKYFADKEKLLFWKQIVLLSAVEAQNQVCDLVKSVVNSFENKLSFVFSGSAEISKISKDQQRIMSIYFLIYMHGFLDWFLMQKEVDDNIINMSIKMFDNIMTASHSI